MIENSEIDGAYVWEYSTVSIKNSVVGMVRAGDMTDVSIANSEIGVIETWGLSWEEYIPTFFVQGSTVKWVEFRSNSSGRFTGSSVAKVEAYGSSNIMFIDSYAGRIETHDESTVFVGWHLPLFGLVTMHYTLFPIVQTIITIAIVMIIIAVLVFLYRKRAWTSSMCELRANLMRSNNCLKRALSSSARRLTSCTLGSANELSTPLKINRYTN